MKSKSTGVEIKIYQDGYGVHVKDGAVYISKEEAKCLIDMLKTIIH